MSEVNGLDIFKNEKLWINWIDIDGKKFPIPEIGGVYYKFDELPPLEKGKKGGVGIVLESLADGSSLAGVDLDGCLVDGALTPWAEEIIEELGTYTEVSPSGTGVKAFFIMEASNKTKMYRKSVQWPKYMSQKKAWGIECYTTGGRFFTVTWRQYRTFNQVQVLSARKLKWLSDRMKAFDLAAKAQKNVIKAFDHIANDDLPWDDWNTKGMALYNATWGSPAGQEAWLTFSQKSPKYNQAEALERWQHWRSSPGDYVTAKNIFTWASEFGYVAEDDIADLYNCREQVLELNNTYSHILMGKNSFILENIVREGKLFEIINIKSWREINAGRMPKFGAKDMPLYDIWLESRYRTVYKGIVLAPKGAAPYPDSMYNIWRGFAIEPKQGSTVGIGAGNRGWEKLKAHLYYIVCKQDIRSWRYLRQWLAHKIQFPGKKLGVAIVLKGDKGAGKTIVTEFLRKIFGPHFVRVSQEQHFLGNFNAHLEQALIVNAEEAFWAGKKKADGILKDMITGDIIQIERKGVDVYQARNLLDVVITSNNDWVVPATHDERRYFVLEVSDEMIGNSAYFNDIKDELEGNGPAAMLFDLLAEDLTDFNPRLVPATDALWEQKLQGMDSHEAYVLKVIEEGRAPGMAEDMTVVKAKLYDRYKDYVHENRGRETPVYEGLFSKFLINKLGCDKVRRRVEGSQVYCLQFPPLQEMRQRANAYFGHTIQWDEKEEWLIAITGGADTKRRNLDFNS